MSDELKVAIEAAKAGAEYALKFFGKNLDIQKKIDKTVVTKVDREVEETIKKVILKSFPNSEFVGEETGEIVKSDTFWSIDPIDGTRHYLRNTPLWAVLISLIKGGEPVVGVSYVPGQNEFMFAEKGHGAFLNDNKIRVSNVSNIDDAILMIGSLRFFDNKTPLLRLIDSTASSRSLVSPYEFHLLASGRAEIVIDNYGKIWDIAPFKVIVEEAGGKVSNSQGEEWRISDTGCIATNGLVCDEVLRIYNEK